MALILIFKPALPVWADSVPIRVGNFSEADLRDWQQRDFVGRTRYELNQKGGRMVLRASSRASSSGLYKRVTADPKDHRILRWSWMVPQLVPGGDLSKKSGDDSPARLTVIFGSQWPGSQRAITYVWANRLPTGSIMASAYNENVKLVVLRSGKEALGGWHSEERDIYQDYLDIFKEAPPPVIAMGIMTDSDDTQSRATACYGDIILEPG